MGWMDLARIVEPDANTSFGGRLANDFFTSSGLGRKTKRFDFGSTEEPITSMTETWQPPTKRRNMLSEEDFAPGPAMTDYLQHIQNVPKREEYSPSIWHRLVGGLSGGVEGGTRGAAAGIKTANEVLDLPYKRAREEYELKGGGLEAAAKLEELQQRNKTAYKRELLQQDEADKDREVKWANSEISKLKANASIQRLAILDEIKKTTNEGTAQRLRNQLTRFDQEHQEAIDRLEVMKMNAGSNAIRAGAAVTSANAAQTKAGAYADYMGQPRKLMPTQIAATRTMVEREVANNNPKWLDASGAVKNEFLPAYEAEVQRNMGMRIPHRTGNIQLPPVDYGNGPDDNPWVEEREP